MSVLDLDQTEVPTDVAPMRRDRLPWVLFAVTLAVLVVTVAIAFGRPPNPPRAESQPTPPPEPTIALETSDGINSGTQVWRDASGAIVGVMDLVRPYGTEDVWCALTVNDHIIKATGSDGWPATCAWISDAV